MLAPLKLLTEPVNSTSASVAVRPSTALWGPEPLATCPALLLIEKMLLLLASAPQVCPSDAVPHSDWLARWKVSCPKVVPGGGGGPGGGEIARPTYRQEVKAKAAPGPS